jgi:acyl transferase domain-containing protein/NAD(P)-dependent dehydrogenase (short-subunit alcohol dehydrogenase family)
MTEVAVVGIGCRFPGGVTTPDEFWQFLMRKGDGVVPIPEDRWSVESYYDPDPDAPGRMYTRHGGFLAHPLWDFDPDFFGISPREASVMDPQQRLLLEVAWEALDDAGLAGRAVGRSVGVYVGGFTNDSLMSRLSHKARPFIGNHTPTSSSFTLLSNRISFCLDLVGPSMTIDTACSSSLVAFHQATQAIARGECEMALVGGVNVMLQPETFVSMCKGRFLSADGRCKSFDAAADGYGRGEGAGMVLLRPLAEATRDRDRIYAVVRGTGANQDGRTIAITVPNPVSQAALAQSVTREAAVAASEIGYVEAHGTGTAVGDPLEMEAIGTAYGRVDERRQDLIVGSVKASIGHTEAAAGIAGIIKGALTVYHRTIAPQGWLQNLNPNIPFTDLRLRVPVEAEPFPSDYEKAVVAVNSFGYGGTNAHVILEEAPAQSVAESRTARPLSVYPVSGRSEDAARAVAAAAADVVANGADLELLTEAAWTRRAHLLTRKALVYRDRGDLLTRLREFAAGQGKPAPRVAAGDSAQPVFVFSGMGPQWWAMGRGLLTAGGEFARVAADVDAAFIPLAGWSIIEELLRDEAMSQIAGTAYAQPANFLLQVALVAEFAAAGIAPRAVVGHSVGEVSAAYVSGALSLRDALMVSYHRARLQAKTEGLGGMLAVGLSETDITAVLPDDGSVSVAAVNSPAAVTLAGPHDALDALNETLLAADVFVRKLRVDVPYHSHLMDPILTELVDELESLSPLVPTVPLYSTVTAARVSGASWNAQYWRDNVRQPVRFADTMTAIVGDGHRVFLEVGPHPVLSGNIREILVRSGQIGAAVATLKRDADDTHRFLEAVGELYVAGTLESNGCPGLTAPDGRPLGPTPFVALPSYPWQRQLVWTEPEPVRRERLGDSTELPMLGRRTDSAVDEWETELSVARLPWLPDHVVAGVTVLPGTAYLDAALSAAAMRTGRSDLALESVRFRSPLVFTDHAVPVLQLTVEPTTRRFTIRSRNLDSDVWTVNATGRLAEGPVEPAPVDLAMPETAITIEGADLYAGLTQRGLSYGPAFRAIVRARVATDCVQAELDLSHLGDTGHVAHPAALDTALQCVAMLAADIGGEGAVIPASVGTVRRYAPLPATATVVVRRRGADPLVADIVLVDAAGNPVAALGEVEFRPAFPPLPMLTRLDRLFYEPVWELAEDRDGGTAAEPSADEFAVVVAFGGESLSRARALLQAHGGSHSHVIEVADPTDGVDARVRDALLAGMTDPDVQGGCVVVVAGKDWTAELNTYGVVVVARGAEWAVAARPDSASDATPCAIRAVIVTENAFCLPADFTGANVVVAPLVGARRSLANEQPHLGWRLIDVEVDTSATELAAEIVASRSLAAHDADEIAFRHGGRWLLRLRANLDDHLAGRDVAVALTDVEASFTVEVPATKVLSDLGLRAVDRTAPGPAQIEVRMDAVGVNFKDPLKVIGVLTEQQLAGTYFGTGLGLEGGGTVVRVGPGVTSVAPGDKVGVGVRNLMTRYLTIGAEEGTTSVVPADWAAGQCSSTLPFLTAEYGLADLAGVAPGETVLIHGAAGGMGLAAVQVAKRLGAKVIGTASTADRRDIVLAAGADAVLNSRSLNFVEDVVAWSGGHGADVVYTSAPGEMVAQNLRVAAEFGRIVDIGKADIYGGGTLDLAPFDRNLSYFAVDMDRMLAHRPATVRSLTRRVVDRLADGTYSHLPYTTYPVSRIAEAFESVARSRHAGRVVLDFAEPDPPVRPQVPAFAVLPDACYLVTGGLGAFGLATARWLVREGGRHLILLGRSGAGTDIARAQLAQFAADGIDVITEAVDVADYEAVLAVITRAANRSAAPLRGVFHTAGVVDSRPIFDITVDTLREVFLPKVIGGWNLHRAVEQLGAQLDAFVLYSSVSALVGGAPQVSYSSANAALDALAATRHAQGKPALALSWGSMGGGGMAQAGTEAARYLALLGFQPVDMDAATDYLAECLSLGIPHAAVMDIDWAEWATVNGPGTRNPRLVEHIAAATASRSGASALQAEILALPEEQRGEVITHILAEQLSVVMGVPSPSIDLLTPLPDMGMDSLMAVEFAARTGKTLGVEISALEFGRSLGLSAVGARLAARLSETARAGSETRDTPTPPELAGISGS